MRVQFDSTQPNNNGFGYTSSVVTNKGDVIEFLVVTGVVQAIVVSDDGKFHAIDLSLLKAL